MGNKGLIILYTGNGKGKTTAALGQMFRALGHGMKVCVIQFIKGRWKTGEMLLSERFSDNLIFKTMGEGFTWSSPDISRGATPINKENTPLINETEFNVVPIIDGSHPFGAKTEINKLHIESAKTAWVSAMDYINCRQFDMVILDELTYLIKYNIIAEEEVIAFLKRRPDNIHIIITGRNASNELMEISDLVTEMKEIKHPYKSGIKAVKGIEY